MISCRLAVGLTLGTVCMGTGVRKLSLLVGLRTCTLLGPVVLSVSPVRNPIAFILIDVARFLACLASLCCSYVM